MKNRRKAKHEELEHIFNPKSMVVIGASETDGYSEPLSKTKIRDKLYLVNPNREKLHGMKCYSSVLDIEDEIDFAIVAVPAPNVPRVIEECVEKGLKAVHVYTSGFSETGLDERIDLEKEIKDIAGDEIRIIGPNCMGIYCSESGLTFSDKAPTKEGSIGVVTQSGTFGVRFLRDGIGRNMKFSKVISYGNAVDLDCIDFLEYLKNDPNTDVIMLYIEGTDAGSELRKTLEEITKKKPLVVLKGGMTEEGSRAATSHTGSMAGKTKVWNSIFKQVGTIQVKTFEDLEDSALAFSTLPYPPGKGISIITPSGGFSVNMTDICVDIGFDVPEFGEETKERLRELIPVAGTSIKNPLDAWPAFMSRTVNETISIVASDRKIHSLILDMHMDISTFQKYLGDKFEEDIFEEFLTDMIDNCKKVKNELEMPIAVSMPISLSWNDEERKYQLKARNMFQNQEIPVYNSIERAAKAIFNLYKYQQMFQNYK